jgi:hypothetical protein
MFCKQIFIVGLICVAGAAAGQSGTKNTERQAPKVGADPGYNIALNVAPYKNEWLFLAHHYGSIKGLTDSAFADARGNAVFKGNKPLQPGIYILASPQKTILFEFLVGADQQFSISADTLNLNETIRFAGSAENERFVGYTRYVNNWAASGEAARAALRKAADTAVRNRLEKRVAAGTKSIDSFRNQYIAKYPTDMLTVLFKAMAEIQLPKALQNPKSNADSVAQYQFSKAHYWDGVDFMDGRLVRTPILESKLKTYLSSWVVPVADSIIYEFNWMIALGRNDPEMFRYLIGYFVDNYMEPKLMGQDKVFLHVFERYIAGDNPKADWLNERQLKIIRKRAYMLMANQLGATAWDMALADTAGRPQNLYGVKADYTVVAFWDVHYAVMVNEESVKEWPGFINEHAKGWVHVHQTAEQRQEEEKAKKPNFRQLYDIRSTPTLFLLDADKKIIAKSVGLTDLDNLLQSKFAQGK